jgi:hypothetical protein
MFRTYTYLKNNNKRDVSKAVVEVAVRAVRERRLSLTVAAFQIRNGPRSTVLQNFKNQQW